MTTSEKTVRDLVSDALLRFGGEKQLLASKIEVSPLLIGRWLSGKADPKPEHLQALRALLAPQGTPLHDDEGNVVRIVPSAEPAPTAAPKEEPPEGSLRCEAQIKACSVSEKNVALGVEISRNELDLSAADHSLVCARVAVRISVDDQQEKLFGDDGSPEAVESVADVAKLSVGPSTIGFRLSFQRSSVDLDAVARYAGKTATVAFKRVGPAGEDGSEVASEGVFQATDPETGEPAGDPT